MISNWRICQAEPSGLLLWFDSMTEFPRLYELEPSLRVGGTPDREGDDIDSVAGEVSQYQQLSLLEEDPSNGS